MDNLQCDTAPTCYKTKADSKKYRLVDQEWSGKLSEKNGQSSTYYLLKCMFFPIVNLDYQRVQPVKSQVLTGGLSSDKKESSRLILPGIANMAIEVVDWPIKNDDCP